MCVTGKTLIAIGDQSGRRDNVELLVYGQGMIAPQHELDKTTN